MWASTPRAPGFDDKNSKKRKNKLKNATKTPKPPDTTTTTTATEDPATLAAALPIMALSSNPAIPTALLALIESPSKNAGPLNSALQSPDLTPVARELALKHALHMLSLPMGDAFASDKQALELELALPATIQAVHDFMRSLEALDLTPEKLGLSREEQGRLFVPTMSGKSREQEVRKAVVKAVKLGERVRREVGEVRERRVKVLRTARGNAAGLVEACQGELEGAVELERGFRLRRLRAVVEQRVGVAREGERREAEAAVREMEEAREKGEMEGGEMGNEGVVVQRKLAGMSVGEGNEAAGENAKPQVAGAEDEGVIVEREKSEYSQEDVDSPEEIERIQRMEQKVEQTGSMKVLALQLKLKQAEGELAFVERTMKEEGIEM